MNFPPTSTVLLASGRKLGRYVCLSAVMKINLHYWNVRHIWIIYRMHSMEGITFASNFKNHYLIIYRSMQELYRRMIYFLCIVWWIIFFVNFGGSKKSRLFLVLNWTIYLEALSDFLGRRTAWMLGRTPPWAMVTPARSLFNSSSFLIASCRCLGMILVFLLSREALPANSRTSAARYSMTAAR